MADAEPAVGVSPTDEQLNDAVIELLQETWDLGTITMNIIKQKCEEKFECTLGPERKAVLKKALQAFLEDQAEADELENGDLKEEQDEEEERGTVAAPKRKGGGGFSKPVQLGNELAAFVGETHLPRSQVVKRLWDYIKLHALQNPSDKRQIRCDAALEKLFKRKTVTMFSMNKYLSPLMKSSADLQDNKDDGEDDEDDEDDGDNDDDDEDGDEKPAAKKRKTSSSSSSSSSKAKPAPKAKKEKKAGGGPAKGNGFTKLMRLSPGLAGILGAESLGRTDVVKSMWVYIREHSLQNPSDKRQILLDGPLKKVFGIDSFTMFSMNKYLKDHLSTIE